MQEQVWISHLQEITLEDYWVKVTDLMGREYHIDPEAALALAVWIAEHRQAVAKAQIHRQIEFRMEESRLYGHLLSSAQVQPEEDQVASPRPSSLPSTPKRRRRSTRKKEDRTDE